MLPQLGTPEAGRRLIPTMPEGSLHSCPHSLLSVFDDGYPSVRQDLIFILICNFLMTNEVEHLFMYSLNICISSLEKCLFVSFAHFSTSYLCFYC